MRQRIVLSTLVAAASLVWGNAWAAGQQTFGSTLTSPAPALGKVVTGSGATLTTFTVNASTGVVTASGGNAVLVHPAASVTPATETLNCTGGNGKDCTAFSKITVVITAGSSTGGRTGTITGFTVAQVSGAGAATSQATTSNPATLSFTLPASGGKFSANQTVSFNIGLALQFANTGAGLDALTSVPYTVTATWQ